DEVALAEPLVRLERFPDPREGADVLVAHDERAVPQRQPVLRHVGSAHARHFDLHQRGVVWNVRQIQLAQLGGRWAYLYAGPGFFGQSGSFLWRNRTVVALRRGVNAGCTPVEDGPETRIVAPGVLLESSAGPCSRSGSLETRAFPAGLWCSGR